MTDQKPGLVDPDLVDPGLVDEASASSWFPKVPPYPLPGDSMLDANKADWRVTPRSAALLVHDMQKFWVDRFEDPSIVVQQIARLITACRQHDVPVVYTVGEKVRNRAERGLSLDLWGPGISSVGGVTDQDAAVLEELAPQQQDYVVQKAKYSAFYDTDLEKILRTTGRSRLIMTGIFAHHGCLATALDAFMRNIEVFFVIDATADYSRDDHDMALRYVAETSGVLTTVEQVVSQLQD